MPCFSQGWCVCLIRGSGVTWLGERNGSEWVCVWLWACVWAKGDENQVSVTWSDCKLRQSICYWGGGGVEKKNPKFVWKKKKIQKLLKRSHKGCGQGRGGGVEWQGGSFVLEGNESCLPSHLRSKSSVLGNLFGAWNWYSTKFSIVSDLLLLILLT